jgi:heme/copper-type cytochrome/quinol oxidase subunit 3
MLGPSFVLTSPAQEAFVVVTAYHLVHVAIGGLALLWALCRQMLGGAKPPMGPLSIYWHFVDALWLFIVGFFYLL